MGRRERIWCPTDPTIFPALQLDPSDQKSLLSTFKAFRFPSSGMVNFEVQIRFCQEKCEQVRCGGKGPSYGRKKRDLKEEEEISLTFNNISNPSLLDDEDVYFDHDNVDSIRAVVQDDSPSIVFSPSEQLHNKGKEIYKSEKYQYTLDEEQGSPTTTFPTRVYGIYRNIAEFENNSNGDKGTEVDRHSETKETDSEEYSLYQSSSTEREGIQHETTPLMKSDNTEKLTNRQHIDKSENIPVLKEHLMSKSYQNENAFELDTISEDSATYAEISMGTSSSSFDENKRTQSTNYVTGTTTDTTESLSTETEKQSDSSTSQIQIFDNPVKETYTSKSENNTPTKQAAIQKPTLSSSFSRKFAFIHNEDIINSTNGYTTPFPSNDQTTTENNLSPNINKTQYHSNQNEKGSFLRPDLKSFSEFHSSRTSQNRAPPFYVNERWPEVRNKDPFSSVRNPYSAPNYRNEGYDGTLQRNKGQDSPNHQDRDRIQPLPMNPQRLVDNSNPRRPWDAPRPVPSHSHVYPPLQSQPLEIHEVSNPWDGSKIRESSNRPISGPHYNIYKSPAVENAEPRVVTTPQSLQDRPRERKNGNMNMWGSNGQHSPSIQIQRPFEILDHPNQRHDRHPSYPSINTQNNHPRPVEIPNNQDAMYQGNRYDYNRPNIPHPRPIELPNQPNVPPNWNINHNRMNSMPTTPIVNADQSVKIWSNNNPLQNTRPPIGNHNGPEEIKSSHRQTYPQIPPMQNPPRTDNSWGSHVNRQSNSNSAPGRNNFYASQPQYRPSEVVATTQKSVPEEVPLSLAILVGEDGKSQNSANQKPKQQWRPPTQFNRGLQRHNIINTPRPENLEEDKVCTSKSTVIATAVSVTLVYLGVVAGAIVGYRWHRKNKRRKAMSTNHPVHFPPNPTNANVTYSTPDVTFRNVYGNFPVSSTSTT
ncbi:uncharacterized protein LOC118201091 isoform X2 [Stegodyphus dumicola]|uniref:uncharacterized protein LOC118201091 isoform X2 n=1 Tax=Stegodyphus dumicola TaxID=202533 RepID=UPI0015AEA1E1|nr:uncharacterized protein LOC118201091 isoform X2 [Stegodyphus dumicola]